jgi:hypothetical protein
MIKLISLLFLLLLATATAAFAPSTVPRPLTAVSLSMVTDSTQAAAAAAAVAPTKDISLYDSAARNAHYGSNTAQYLVDLHDHKATFDFCGGMLFQFVLTDALRNHLVQVAAANTNSVEQQPVIFDASNPRMSMTPSYSQTADADNSAIFYGREIRQVVDAAGGMGMVLQLSLASPSSDSSSGNKDPQGWTPQEVQRYDGWGHDSGREWRKGPQLEQEGFSSFRTQFGPSAYSLHHRFYLHLDKSNRMWLSAEDGCEGTPVNSSNDSSNKPSLSNLFGLL